MYLQSRCTYSRDVLTVEMYFQSRCTSSRDVLTVDMNFQSRCTYSRDVLTVEEYLQSWCTYSRGVLTVEVYLQSRFTSSRGVLTVEVYSTYFWAYRSHCWQFSSPITSSHWVSHLYPRHPGSHASIHVPVIEPHVTLYIVSKYWLS